MNGYDFSSSDTYKPDRTPLSIDDFRVTAIESTELVHFMGNATSYCLLQNGLPCDKGLIGLQAFISISTNAPKPEVGVVKYVQVLDEVADSKDTVLHIISELYEEYISKHKNKFLILEGDAKTYDIVQAVKFEYDKILTG